MALCNANYRPLAQYAATQINTKINDVQKQIGMKKKVFRSDVPRGVPFVRNLTRRFTGQRRRWRLAEGKNRLGKAEERNGRLCSGERKAPEEKGQDSWQHCP